MVLVYLGQSVDVVDCRSHGGFGGGYLFVFLLINFESADA